MKTREIQQGEQKLGYFNNYLDENQAQKYIDEYTIKKKKIK